MQYIHLEKFSVNKEYTNDRVLKYFENNKHSAGCDLGNKVLYNMCKENIEHIDEDTIASKIWLIGRSYAAALERRKNADGYNPYFYTQVAKRLIKKILYIDKTIQYLNNCEFFNETNADTALELHYSLTKFFYEETKLNKRSLASKYLHFHCPNVFFIYDSRARQNLSKYIHKSNKKIENTKNIDYDYMIFCNRMLKLQRYIYNNFNQCLSTRELDDLLLYYTK